LPEEVQAFRPGKDPQVRQRKFSLESRLSHDERAKDRAGDLGFFAALMDQRYPAASQSEDGPKSGLADSKTRLIEIGRCSSHP
jgi:hypothetical protein